MSDNDKIKARQDSDQAWAYMRRYYGDIDRIANGGIDDDESDKLLVQKLAQLVRGEMTLRILDAEGQ